MLEKHNQEVNKNFSLLHNLDRLEKNVIIFYNISVTSQRWLLF